MLIPLDNDSIELLNRIDNEVENEDERDMYKSFVFNLLSALARVDGNE